MKMFDTHKTRMIVLPCGEKIVTIMLRRFDTIGLSERDGQTYRRTDGQNWYINIACQCADAHDKNSPVRCMCRSDDVDG